jgi:hypothetical protein
MNPSTQSIVLKISRGFRVEEERVVQGSRREPPTTARWEMPRASIASFVSEQEKISKIRRRIDNVASLISSWSTRRRTKRIHKTNTAPVRYRDSKSTWRFDGNDNTESWRVFLSTASNEQAVADFAPTTCSLSWTLGIGSSFLISFLFPDKTSFQ